MPSARGDKYRSFPLSGSPAKRICALMGWYGNDAAFWRLVDHFHPFNAQYRHGPWDLERARRRVLEHLMTETDVPVVVALGRRPAEALPFSPREWEFYEWRERETSITWGEGWEGSGPTVQAVMIPHTSGLNRMWNDPDTEGRVKRALTEALERAAA